MAISILESSRSSYLMHRITDMHVKVSTHNSGHSFAFDREPVTTTDGARLSGVRENRTPTPCAACHFIAADGTAIGRLVETIYLNANCDVRERIRKGGGGREIVSDQSPKWAHKV